MSIELFLYLADVVPSIGKLCFILAIIILGIAFAFVVETGKPRVAAKIAAVAVVLFAVDVIIPSKQTIYLMAGANVAKQAMNSSVGEKVQRLIEKELDKFLEKAK